MGKKSIRHIKARGGYAYKGWKKNSKDGKFLEKLLTSGELPAAAAPSLVKERYPQFKKYKRDSLASGLRRLKHQLGLFLRDGGGADTGEFFFVLCLFVCRVSRLFETSKFLCSSH